MTSKPTKVEALISAVFLTAMLLPTNEMEGVQQAGAFVWLALGGIALAVVGGLLIPKPKGQARFDDRPPQLVTRGQAMPYVIGRRTVSMYPVWLGRRIFREEKVSTGGKKGGGLFGGGSSKQTVVYEDGVHILTLGPASILHSILRGSEEVIFQGPISADNTPSGTQLQDLEGNSFRIYWGERNQPVNTDLGQEDALGIASRWPDIAYIQWEQRKLGSSAVWEQLNYDIETSCVGKLPLADSDCMIPPLVAASGTGSEYDPGSQDGGVNGAHMLYQLLTASSPHGSRLPVGYINWRSLKNLGSLAQNERLAQNVLIIDDALLRDVVAEILIDMGVFLVEEQGLLNFVPLREDDEVLEIDNNVIVSPQPTFSIDHGNLGNDRIIWLFPDVLQAFTETDITTDDDATASATLRNNSRTVRISTVTHENHASRVADRRKQLLLADANEVRLDVNRTMRRLMPGHVTTLPNIGQVRVKSVEKDLQAFKTQVTAAVDQYSLVDSAWDPSLPTAPPPPSQGGPDTVVRVLEAGRRFAGSQLAVVVLRGREAGDATQAVVYGSLNGISYTELGTEPSVAAYGKLASDFFVRPVGFRHFKRFEDSGPLLSLSSGNAARLVDLTGLDEDWRQTRQALLIGDEIMSVRRFLANGDGTYTPEGLIREQMFTQHGQYDSTNEPEVMVFEPELFTLFTHSSWSVGSTVYIKVVPKGQSIDSIQPVTIELTGKALGALPIENLQPRSYTGGDDIDFSWSYRLNKGSGAAAGELKAGTAVPLDPGDEGDFVVEALDTAFNVKRTEIVDDPSWTYTDSDKFLDGIRNGDFYLRVTARSGGIGGYPRTYFIRST